MVLVLRQKCAKIIHENTVSHFDKLLAIINDWVGNRLLAQLDDGILNFFFIIFLVSQDEWETMKKFIAAFITAVYQLEATTPVFKVF